MNHAMPQPAMATSRRRIWIDRPIDLIVFLWLFLLSEAIIPLTMLGGQQDFSDEQKIFFQNIFKPFIIISFGLLILYFRGMTAVLIKNPFLVLLAIWMWMSSAWSMDPDITLRRSLLHSSFIIMSCFVAYRYKFEDIIKLLFCITAMIVISSFYFVIFDPFLGFNPDGRGARGVFMHKNSLGNFLVVGVAVSVSALRLHIVPRLSGLAVLMASLTLLVMANSTTALFAVAVMSGVYVLVTLKENLSWRSLVVLVSFFVSSFVFATMLLIANIDDVFLLLGRDATLTGRDNIWHYALTMIQERMILGYGYAAFWETEPISSYVTDVLQWDITHAHNGFLQVWLELGLIGIGLFIIFLIVCIFRAAFSPLPDHVQAFILPLFIALIISDFVETHLFVYKHFGWIVMLIFVFATTPGLTRIRNQTNGDVGSEIKSRKMTSHSQARPAQAQPAASNAAITPAAPLSSTERP